MNFRDRVAQTTNASGIGDLTLDGTLAGFKTFAGALPALPAASDKPFPVLVRDGDAWELFESYLITGTPNSLFRGALISSSAIDGSRINLSNAADKPVYLLETAESIGPMGGRSKFVLTAGTAPDYTAVFPVPIRALKAGTRCTIAIHAANPSSPVTFAPDGLTAKPIKAGRPLRTIAPGRLPLGLLVDVEFSETDDCWIVLSPLPQVTKTVSASTYTILEEDHEGTLVFTNAGGCAVTVPQATGQFAASFWANFLAAGGTVTFTPATSTINGGTSLALATGQTGRIFADGGNYRVSAGEIAAGAKSSGWGLFGRNYSSPNTGMEFFANDLLLKDANGRSRAIPRLGASSGVAGDITLSGISGLDTGAEANSTWYTIFAVDRTTPIVDAPVTLTPATDRVNHPAHGLPANAPILINPGGAGGLSATTVYYVKNPNTNDYQVSTTPGGAAVDITSAGAGVTVSTTAGIVYSTFELAPTMPAGYTYSAFIGAVFNNSLGNFIRTVISGRTITFDPQLALNNGSVTTPGTYQSLDISAIVPSWARSVNGIMGRNATTANAALTISVAGSSNWEGAQPWGAYNASPATAINNFAGGCGPFVGIALRAQQTLFWTASATTAEVRIAISGINF